MSADAREQVAKISKGLDAQTLAAGDKTAQHGRSSSAFVASVEQPVASANNDIT